MLEKNGKSCTFNGITFYRTGVTGDFYSDFRRHKIKISLHRYIYEYHHGKIPDNHTVIFIDGNRNNFDIDNLFVITMSELKHKSRFNYMNNRLHKTILHNRLKDKYKTNSESS